MLLDAVYEPHYERYKEDFGKTIAGFFSDDPVFTTVLIHCLTSTPSLAEKLCPFPGHLSWNPYY